MSRGDTAPGPEPARRGIFGWGLAIAAVLALGSPAAAQTPPKSAVPRNEVDVTFAAAPPLEFPNPTDSNSPVVWDGDRLLVFNSIGGQPRRAVGTSINDAGNASPDDGRSAFDDDVHTGRWLEAVVRDDASGLLYGWYHEEVRTDCPQGLRLWPQIGAVVSRDDGATWDELGLILTPREGSVTCDTNHPVTNGGIGDFSVILDGNSDPGNHYAYFVFSSYGGALEEQGISFARMLWIDRDQPVDRFSGESMACKWDGVGWNGSGLGGYSAAIFHDDHQVSWTSVANNGFWGPSVHWNRDLRKFIVLMSRSVGGNYESGGVYMTYTTALDDPRSWALPKLVLGNQGWYPQVVGDAAIAGTDKLAGARARYFNQGSSSSLIVFRDAPR